MKKEITRTKQDYNKILNSIINYIEKSKLRAFSEINKALLNAYWNIGKELSKNASYGKSVVEQLSRDLRLKYPNTRGYSAANLWNMKRFYDTYQKLQPAAGESKKLQPLVAELLFNVSWTNHVLILDKTSSNEEREFYIKMCIKERWSKRELDRQLDSSLFERYMIADRPEKVTALIPKHETKDLAKHFKDEYVLEFLNLRKEYSEQELEEAILDNLRDFFLEFGRSFTFVGSQYTINIGGKENKIDLLFYHRELKCLVAVDLKIGEFKAEYVGQMQKYLAALDEKIRLPDEKQSIMEKEDADNYLNANALSENKVVERARSSMDKTTARLTGISREFYFDSENGRNQHTLVTNSNNNYINFSVHKAIMAAQAPAAR